MDYNDSMPVEAELKSAWPAPKWQVENELDNQTKTIHALMDCINLLEKKLDPILSVWSESCENWADREQLCAVANIIRSNNDRLASNINILNEIIRRIEL